MTSGAQNATGPAQPGRALITGSAAPFAERLVRRLESLGWEVDTHMHDDPNLVPPPHAMHVPGPTPNSLDSAVREADTVILLSGIDSLTSMVDDSGDLDAILATLAPGSTLVEVTTMAVFGNAGDQPVSEQDQPRVPADLDPVAACETRVMASEDWLRGIVVRPGLVYGDQGGLALEPAVELARSQRVSRFFGDGRDTLPTVHEDDLLDLLTRVVSDPSARGVYHAAAGSTTTRGLAEVVASAAGIDTVEPWTPEAWQAEFGTTSQPPRINVRADGEKGRAAVELGWRPTARSLAQAVNG